jgi:hypothetical protein
LPHIAIIRAAGVVSLFLHSGGCNLFCAAHCRPESAHGAGLIE